MLLLISDANILMDVEVGDLVTLTVENLPDVTTGALGLDGAICEVLRRSIDDVRGVVALTLLHSTSPASFRLLSPSGVALSVGASSITLTDALFNDADQDATAGFYAGQVIEVWSPDLKTARGTATLTFTVSQPAGNPTSTFSFTDTLPVGLQTTDGKGKVVMLRYAEGSASTNEREQGFVDAIKKSPGIELVSSNQYGGATTESAQKASENLLAPYKSADGKLGIDGIFCPNESTTFGMLRALQDARLAGSVKFVGFDSSEKLVDALAAKELHGLVLQDPMNMGYLGVKTMVAHLNGETVEKRISTGENLATPENMNEPEMQALLKPDYQKWLKE